MRRSSYCVFSGLLVLHHCFARLSTGALEAESAHSHPVAERLHLLDEGHPPSACDFPQVAFSEQDKSLPAISYKQARLKNQNASLDVDRPDHTSQVPPLEKTDFKSLPRDNTKTKTKKFLSELPDLTSSQSCSEENVDFASTSRLCQTRKSKKEKDTLMPLFQLGVFSTPTASADDISSSSTRQTPVPPQISTDAPDHMNSALQHTSHSEPLHGQNPPEYNINIPLHNNPQYFIDYLQPQLNTWPQYPVEYIASSNIPQANVPFFMNTQWSPQSIYGFHQPESFLYSSNSGSYENYFPPPITAPNPYFLQYGQLTVGTSTYTVPVNMPVSSYPSNYHYLHLPLAMSMAPHSLNTPYVAPENTMQARYGYYSQPGSEAVRPVQYPGPMNPAPGQSFNIGGISVIKHSKFLGHTENLGTQIRGQSGHGYKRSSKVGKRKRRPSKKELNQSLADHQDLQSVVLKNTDSEIKNNPHLEHKVLVKLTEEETDSTRKDLDTEYNEWLMDHHKIEPKVYVRTRLGQDSLENHPESSVSNNDCLQVDTLRFQENSELDLNSAQEFPPLQSSLGQRMQWLSKPNKGEHLIPKGFGPEISTNSGDGSEKPTLESKRVIHDIDKINAATEKSESLEKMKKIFSKTSDRSLLFDSIPKPIKQTPSTKSSNENCHSNNLLNDSIKSSSVLREIKNLSEAKSSQRIAKKEKPIIPFPSISRDTLLDGKMSQSNTYENTQDSIEHKKIVVPSSIRSSKTKFNVRKRVKTKESHMSLAGIETSLHQTPSKSLHNTIQMLLMTGTHIDRFALWIFSVLSKVGKVAQHQICIGPHKLVNFVGEIITQGTQIGLRYTKEYEMEMPKNVDEKMVSHDVDHTTPLQPMENQVQQRKKKKKVYMVFNDNDSSLGHQKEIPGNLKLSENVNQDYHHEEGSDFIKLIYQVYQLNNNHNFHPMNLQLGSRQKFMHFGDFRWESLPPEIMHSLNLPLREFQRRTQVLSHQESQFIINESWKDHHQSLDPQIAQWLVLIFQVEKSWPTFSEMNESFKIWVKHQLNSIPKVGGEVDTMKMILGKELDRRRELISYMIDRESKPIWWDEPEMNEARRQGINILDLIKIGDILCFESSQTFEKMLLDKSKLVDLNRNLYYVFHGRKTDPENYPVSGADWVDSPERDWLCRKPELWKIYQSNLKKLILSTDQARLYLSPVLLSQMGISSKRTWWSGGDLLIWNDQSAPIKLMNKIGESLNLKNYRELRFDMIPMIKRKIKNQGLNSETRKRMMFCFEKRCELNLEIETKERNKGLIWKVKDYLLSAWS